MYHCMTMLNNRLFRAIAVCFLIICALTWFMREQNRKGGMSTSFPSWPSLTSNADERLDPAEGTGRASKPAEAPEMDNGIGKDRLLSTAPAVPTKDEARKDLLDDIKNGTLGVGSDPKL